MSAGGLTLLVGVDGSAAALRAVAHALRLSKETRCEIYLCNVQPANAPPPRLAQREAAGVNASPGMLLLQEALHAVSAAGLRAYADVRHGEPAQEIARQAREVGADLILVGTRGLRAASEALLGSVAQRIVQLAPCPVVILR